MRAHEYWWCPLLHACVASLEWGGGAVWGWGFDRHFWTSNAVSLFLPIGDGRWDHDDQPIAAAPRNRLLCGLLHCTLVRRTGAPDTRNNITPYCCSSVRVPCIYTHIPFSVLLLQLAIVSSHRRRFGPFVPRCVRKSISLNFPTMAQRFSFGILVVCF